MPFIESIGLGASAIFGLGIGARALRPVAMPALKKIASGGFKAASFGLRKGILPFARETLKTAPWATKGIGSLAFKTGRFALRHPYMTAGAIGTGYFLTTEKSPYQIPSLTGQLEGVRLSSRFNEEQMAADALNESGIAPMGGIVSGAAIRNQRLMQSTQGLNFGLHRMRH